MAHLPTKLWPTLTMLLAVAVGAGGTDYYVSPTGSDANPGTSPAQAWQTIGKVNSSNFGPGDRLLFEGGQTFTGGMIYFNPPDGGTPANPLVVSSYGTGRATIMPGTADGLFAWNCAGIVISNLNFVGAGRDINTGSGINFYNDGGAGAYLDYVKICDVEVSGFGRVGIVLGSWTNAVPTQTNGYRNVRFERCVARDNRDAGIGTYGAFRNLQTNVYVGDCVAYRNLGNPANTTGNSGNGIVLGSVNDALIERCIAYTNGWLNGATSEGPVGIWTYDSTRVTIQFCESFRNGSGTAVDGDGFDFDQHVSHSVMQYNYSHDNFGAGFLVWHGKSGATHTNNIIRYNISQNDCRNLSYGAIHVGGSGVPRGLQIYQNTIYLTPVAGRTPAAIKLLNVGGSSFARNNILQTTGGVRLLDVAAAGTNMLFQGNAYWTSGGNTNIVWAGVTYTSLDAWLTARPAQERVAGNIVALEVNPLLTAPGTGPAFTNVDLLATLTAYQLQPQSPLIDAGQNLIANPGARDFYGNPVPQGATFDVGAHDTKPTVSIAATTPAASEFGPVNGAFTVTRTGGTVTNLVVTLVASGTADSGVDYLALPATVNISAGASNTVVAVVPIPDDWAEGDETVTGGLVASNLYALGLASAGVTIHDKPADAWRFAWFAGNPPGSGDPEDFDGDGLPNLLEYALGLNPTAMDGAATTVGVMNGFLTFTYTRPEPAPVDLHYAVGVTDGLTNWCYAPSCTTSQVTVNGGTATVRTSDTVPVSDAVQRFLRLKVTRLP